GVTEECAPLCVARGDGGWELLSDARGGVETAVEQADDTGEPGHRLVAATVRGARVCRTGVAIVATARGPDHTRRPGQRGGRGSGRRSEGRRAAGRCRGGTGRRRRARARRRRGGSGRGRGAAGRRRGGAG